MEEMYRRVTELTFAKKGKAARLEIDGDDGVIITAKKEVLNRWKGYIECLCEADKQPKLMEIENGFEGNEEEKGYFILKCEVEKAIQEMENRKACGMDGIPVELLRGLEEVGVYDITYLCKMIYDSQVWPDDFLTTIMILIEKKKNT